MKSFTKNLALAILSSSLFLAYAPMAEEQKTKVIHLKTHKNIEFIDGDGMKDIKRVIMLNGEELSDDVALEEKLADLDPETREKVLSLLGDIDVESYAHDDTHVVKKGIVKILRKDDETGKIIDITSDSDDIDLSVFNLSELDGGAIDLSSSIIKIMGDHTEATIKMIKNGEFTQNELDRIQVALDEKR